MTEMKRGVFVCTALFVAAWPTLSMAATSCESLLSLKLKDTTIDVAKAFDANEFTPTNPSWRRSAVPLKPVPVAFCRVAGTIKPTGDSDIKFEVWLPTSEKWTGRYESVGNGGFAGAIRYDSMRRPLLSGTAVASTDDGHDTPGATFALGHPEKVVDYAYRAVHVTADAGKALTAAYYGSKPKKAYFVGCSKGGGEGLMSAYRYPEDFDGILSISPANDFTGLFVGFGMNQNLMADKESYVSREEMEKVAAVVLDSCDAQDGVKDGLVGLPHRCQVKREALPLSDKQAAAYFRIIDGPRKSDGTLFYPGYSLGSEVGSRNGWVSDNIRGGFDEARREATQSTFARGFFANFVYNKPDWDFDTFDIDRDGKAAIDAVGKWLDMKNPNLDAFRARGGKLIQFNGWVDVEVNPKGGLMYYEQVVARNRPGGAVLAGSDHPKDPAYAKTQEFYRLFMGAGVSHCRGGPGPNEFGQQGGDQPASHDMVSALYRWVEEGVGPTQVVATKFTDDDPEKPVAMTRPVCMYPLVPKYKGQGSTNEAQNFVCGLEN